MLITTSKRIEGKRITQTLGMVMGSSVRTRSTGRDIIAALRNLVGGEVPEYIQLMAQSREQAIQRMVEDAENQGANAIVGMRFSTASVKSAGVSVSFLPPNIQLNPLTLSGAAEMLAYGTAVKVE